MACYKPLKGWMSPKGGIVFNRKDSIGQEMQVPCGQCIGCRLDYSRDWAVRCTHEMKTWRNNTFITLTYDNEHLPKNGSLDVTDFQKFMKRLRKKHKGIQEINGEYPIRFFHCGEYGDATKRPHYHAILFNFKFPDQKATAIRNGKKVMLPERNGIQVYDSEDLNQLWGNGNTEIGTATWNSAAYIARYVVKKAKGATADEKYSNTIVDPSTGEVIERVKITPEYVTMSRRPAIGRHWYDRFGYKDLWAEASAIIRDDNGKSRKMRIPRYYQEIYREQEPDKWRQFKKNNREYQESLSVGDTLKDDHNLKMSEEVQYRRSTQLVRKHNQEQ